MRISSKCIIAMMMLSVAVTSCKTQATGQKDVKNVQTLTSHEDEKDFRDAFTYVYFRGKDIVPLLIEKIDEKDGLFLQRLFYGPYWSNLPDFLFTKPGVVYAYMIDFICSQDVKEKEFLPVDTKNINNDAWYASIAPYRIYDYGVIIHKGGDENSFVPVSYEDMQEIKAYYENWWKDNRDKPLSQIRKEWTQGGVLKDTPYQWL